MGGCLSPENPLFDPQPVLFALRAPLHHHDPVLARYFSLKKRTGVPPQNPRLCHEDSEPKPGTSKLKSHGTNGSFRSTRWTTPGAFCWSWLGSSSAWNLRTSPARWRPGQQIVAKKSPCLEVLEDPRGKAGGFGCIIGTRSRLGHGQKLGLFLVQSLCLIVFTVTCLP